LDREPEGLAHQMNVIDVNDFKMINEWEIPYWEIEEHWKFIEKSIELMEQPKV
jgi:hypothetical protein